MKCSEVRGKLAMYCERALVESEERNVAEHLRDCLSCGKEHGRYVRSWDMLSRYGEIEPSADFVGRSVERCRREDPIVVLPFARAGRWFAHAGLPLSAAAALLLSLLLPAFWNLVRLDEKQSPPSAVAVDILPEDAEVINNLDLISNIELARFLDVIEDDAVARKMSFFAEIDQEENR